MKAAAFPQWILLNSQVVLHCVHLYFIGLHGVSLIIVSYCEINVLRLLPFHACVFSHWAYELFISYIGMQQQHKREVLRFILWNHLFILCLNSKSIVSSPEGLTVFHFSGQKQGSWRLDAQTSGLPPTATHHADSHPADKPGEKDNLRENHKESWRREKGRVCNCNCTKDIMYCMCLAIVSPAITEYTSMVHFTTVHGQ